MQIYPSIDIRKGRCVRLVQGKQEKETVYANYPVEVALRWKSVGATYLHVIDLDGAFTGNAGNILVLINGNIRGKVGKKGEVIDSLVINSDFNN